MNFYFMCDRSGSQPANLENVGRRPSLQTAQSDSNLRTGTLTETHTTHSCLRLSLFTLNVKWMLLCRFVALLWPPENDLLLSSQCVRVHQYKMEIR